VGPELLPRVLRTETERPVELPARDWESRPETERRDAWEEREEREEGAEGAEDVPGTEVPPEPPEPAPEPAP
jgi:hypothetical protein